MNNSIYLGDGVYASYDGWHIWLTTGSHVMEEADNKIALEPEVFSELLKYNEGLKQNKFIPLAKMREIKWLNVISLHAIIALLIHPNMSELYVNSFKPLKLPSCGEDLLPGRQYYIDPVARIAIDETYGFFPPKVVECLQKRCDPATIWTIHRNDRTRKITKQRMSMSQQEECFIAFFSKNNKKKFSINLAKLHESRAFYADCDRVKDLVKEEKPKKPARLKKAPKLDEAVMELLFAWTNDRQKKS